MRRVLFLTTLLLAVIFAVVFAIARMTDDSPSVEEGRRWNEGVEHFRAGDATNALDVFGALANRRENGEPTALAARAAEVAAKLQLDRNDREEAAKLAQIALHTASGDSRARANRNFTRAVDGLLQQRETKHINEVLERTKGQDPGSMMRTATYGARRLLAEAGGLDVLRTNAPAHAVALADELSATAGQLADTWIPLRKVIVESVTNQEQAATILAEIEQAQTMTKKAAREFGDLSTDAYGSISSAERDFTRFLKLTILPPAAMDEDLIAQSNAWLDAETVNGRVWQPEALAYTRAFRKKFPAWAQAYEQQAQADTNRPPFTKEAQDKISALTTTLEKLQLECCEKSLPPKQEQSLKIIDEIRNLLPKDPNGGNSGNQQQNQQQKNQDKNQQQQQDQQKQDQQQDSNQKQDQDPNQQDKQPPEADEQKNEEQKQDPELEATLRKAQERNDEHEADKKARMRKVPLPPNERDW